MSAPSDSDACMNETSDMPYMKIEARPQRIFAALYDQLPFPTIGPVQDLSVDIGVTAMHGAITLAGVVFKAYADHQLIFEQRWPSRIIRGKTGESDLRIEAQTGLALRAVQFLVHGYEAISMLEVTAIGIREIDEERVEAQIQIPVSHPKQKTVLHFPLAGTWWAIQAADWSDQHKAEVFSQTYATDFVRLGPDNRFFANEGTTVEDHYSWDQPVYAAAGGKVAYACFDMPDLVPGQTPDPRMFRDDLRRLLGNAVAISHANGEFSYYAHLQQASLQVNDGQVIRRGALLGRIGNSGHSPGPHLHFHLMDGPNLFIDQGLPAKFTHFWAGGKFYESATFIPTRMIVSGPMRPQSGEEDDS